MALNPLLSIVQKVVCYYANDFPAIKNWGVTEPFVKLLPLKAEIRGVYNQLKGFYGNLLCQKSFITCSPLVIGHFFDTIIKVYLLRLVHNYWKITKLSYDNQESFKQVSFCCINLWFSPAGGPSRNPNAVVCTSYRSSNYITCKK